MRTSVLYTKTRHKTAQQFHSIADDDYCMKMACRDVLVYIYIYIYICVCVCVCVTGSLHEATTTTTRPYMLPPPLYIRE